MAKKTKEKKTSWKMMAWGLAVLATVFIISYYLFNSCGTIEYKNLVFSKDRPVYISINSSGLSQCEDISFAPQTLSSFLGSNLLTTKAGAPDIAFANVSNVPYVTCDTHPNNIGN